MKHAKNIKWLLCLCCLLAALCAFTLAANAEIVDYGTCGAEGDGSNLTWTLDDAGTLTISGTGKMIAFKTINECTSAPWGGSKSNAQRVKNVVIHNSVTSIGDSAFYGCTELASISIPNSLTSIGENTFFDCEQLTNVSIPDSVIEIGVGAFSRCKNLKTLELPFVGLSRTLKDKMISSIKSTIEDKSISSVLSEKALNQFRLAIPTFYKTYGMLGIIFETEESPSSSEYYYSQLGFKGNFDSFSLSYYYYIPKSLENVVIGTGMDYVEAEAFVDCSGIKSITISDSIMNIGASAFSGCDNLDRIYYIGTQDQWKAVKNASNRTPSFYDCLFSDGVVYNSSKTKIQTVYNTTIRQVTIPDSVTNIADNAFFGCTELTEITIPDNVTSIADNAFSGCTGISSVSIKNPMTKVYKTAFSDTPWYNNHPDGVVYTNNFVFSYKGTMPENATISLKKGTTGILSNAFSDCVEMSSITIPDSVTQIGDSAFSGCSGLLKVTIPDSIIQMGENAFSGCKRLGTVVLGNGLSEIPKGTFSNCTNLFDVIIPKGIKKIGAEAFKGCNYYLKEITIPGNVTNIEESAFSGCSALTKITLNEGLTSIGESAFLDCSSLKEITIPVSVTEIKTGAFKRVNSLNRINYAGSEQQWKQILIEPENDALFRSKIVYNYEITEAPAPCQVHSWDKGKTIKQASCLETGQKIFTCTVCGETKTEIIPLSENHTWDNGKVTKQASCSATGTKTFTCSICGAEKNELIPLLTEHKWDAGKETKAPTCNEKGVRTYTCTVCNAVKTEEIAAKGHSPVTDKAVAATCTTDGKTEGSHCSVCNAIIKGQETVNATGHAFGAWTKLNDTQHQRVCANDKTHIEKANHTWDAGTVTKEATSDVEGERIFTCADCGATKTEKIPKTEPEKPEHSPGDVDGDGKLTSADARLALRASVGLEPDIAPGTDAYLACDADGDGKVSSADARLILRASVGLEDPRKFGKKA